jgi:dethiobiotin synthase
MCFPMLTKYRFVILGTDTEVGKTWVACGMARALMEMGYNTIAVKPVETGCQLGSTLGQDGARLAQATGQPRPRLALKRFREPVAPPVAAEKEGVTLVYKEIVAAIEESLEEGCVGIIEGVGGLLSPLTWDRTMLDLARDMNAQVILVCADRLGTLNHTRMALRILAAEALAVAAVVMSEVAPFGQLHRVHEDPSTAAPKDRSAGRNLAALKRVEEIQYLTYLPYVEDVEEAAGHLRPLVGRLISAEQTHENLA